MAAAVLVGLVAPAFAARAQPAPFAYVANLGNTVSQYDAAFGPLSPLSPAIVATGAGPHGVAVSPDGQSMYIANHDSHTVSQYSVGSGGVLSPKTPATVATGGSPHDVAVSPDGQSIYVTNYIPGNTVSQYSVGSGGTLSPKTPATVATGDEPWGIAISPKAATQLSVNPQLVLFPPPNGVGLGNVSATLTSGGQPVAGRTIAFSTGGTQLCSSTTAANGTASCSADPSGELAVLLSNSYTATFAGETGYLASSTGTPAVELGGGLALAATAGRAHVAIADAVLSGHGVRYAILGRHARSVSRLRRLRLGRYTLTVTLTDDRRLTRTVTLR